MTSSAPTGGARDSDPPDQSHPGRPNPTAPEFAENRDWTVRRRHAPCRSRPPRAASATLGHVNTPAEPADEPTLPADFTRRWWIALLTNAADLLDDAETLHQNNSFARARSLAILAREEALPWCEFKESNLA